jgi:PAS domain S-box-containing protein
MFDRDGNPKYVNDAYLRLIGLDRDTFEQAASRGLAWRDTIYEEDIELTTHIWSRMRDSKTPQTFEYRVKIPSKKPDEMPGIRTLETISFPEIDENGQIVTVQGWLVDISPRKRLETLMAQRLEDALETRRASENFIDMGRLARSFYTTFTDGIKFRMKCAIRSPLFSSSQMVFLVLSILLHLWILFPCQLIQLI